MCCRLSCQGRPLRLYRSGRAVQSRSCDSALVDRVRSRFARNSTTTLPRKAHGPGPWRDMMHKLSLKSMSRLPAFSRLHMETSGADPLPAQNNSCEPRAASHSRRWAHDPDKESSPKRARGRKTERCYGRRAGRSKRFEARKAIHGNAKQSEGRAMQGNLQPNRAEQKLRT